MQLISRNIQDTIKSGNQKNETKNKILSLLNSNIESSTLTVNKKTEIMDLLELELLDNIRENGTKNTTQAPLYRKI